MVQVGIRPVLCQTFLKPCKCGGFRIELEVVCPRCIARGEQRDLLLIENEKSGRNEYSCFCGFRCWKESYKFYRKIAQRFICSGSHEIKTC